MHVIRALRLERKFSISAATRTDQPAAPFLRAPQASFLVATTSLHVRQASHHGKGTFRTWRARLLPLPSQLRISAPCVPAAIMIIPIRCFSCGKVMSPWVGGALPCTVD